MKMKKLHYCWTSILVALAISSLAPLEGEDAAFQIGEKDFVLHGRPMVIRSGEIHYARIPREYWEHRLRMARAMGLNTVSTYVFWNVHEPVQGQFDFGDNADIAEFCRIAQREGLKVIVRPGPYVCAEWDFGGLPWWLLKDPGMRVRSAYPPFMEACRHYFRALGEQLAPLQISRGGPIIMVQVENEYGGYGRDGFYIAALREALRQAGFDVPQFSSEMTWSLRADVEPDLFRAVGLGRNPAEHFVSVRAVQPAGPFMAGELYTGWFDRWGQGAARGGGHQSIVDTLEWMEAHHASFNLYMAHGGTSFGFRSGANAGPYTPQPTSYDYTAPISEAGWATPKYHAIRELLARRLEAGQRLPDIPERPPVIEVPAIELTEIAPLLENLPEGRRMARPHSMEYLDQSQGLVLYRTRLRPGGGERMMVREPRDYAVILLDGERIGALDRGRRQRSIVLPEREDEATLDLLVEAMGRVNYGEQMHDRKGITERVDFIEGRMPRELTGWEVFNLPLDEADLARLRFRKGETDQPAFHRGRFNLRQVGDTFLDMRDLGKGAVWVNGYNLGRFWNLGPQQTLYCPGPWLRRGVNEIIVLELTGARNRKVAGLSEPILDQLNLEAAGRIHRKPGQALDLTGLSPTYSGSFPPGISWHAVQFNVVQGRYIALEALDSHPGDDFTTCAELHFLGADGAPLRQDGWKVIYASSEEAVAEDGGANNVLDGQPESFWHTEWHGTPTVHPHHLVIDLGREEAVGGFRYLPRQDMPNGRIKDFRLYISQNPFRGL
jgi:beta-galactosidase